MIYWCLLFQAGRRLRFGMPDVQMIRKHIQSHYYWRKEWEDTPLRNNQRYLLNLHIPDKGMSWVVCKNVLLHLQYYERVDVIKSFHESLLVNEIAATSDEQAKGIKQINIGINELKKITQQNAAYTEESARAAEELNS